MQQPRLPFARPRLISRWFSVHFFALTCMMVMTSGALSQTDASDDVTPRASHTEQSIYIPYKKLREVFEREGRGVFIPYEEFMALWDAARENGDAEPVDDPPFDALITEISNEATVSQDVVAVAATISIELLRSGWNEVPLRLNDAAITNARIDGAPARIVHRAGRGYWLIHENTTDQPMTISLELDYAKSYSRAPGRNDVSFESPQAPISRWRVAVPEEGVKINLRPLIAATEVPANEDDGGAGGSVLLAFVGAASSVHVNWTPRSEGATGLTALADVTAHQQLRIGEGVVRTLADLRYEISRAALSSLTIDVPADEKIVEVSDANVRQWKAEPVTVGGVESQRITIELFEAVRGTQNIRLELERLTNGTWPMRVDAPVIRTNEAARQSGIVVIKADDGLSTDVQSSVGLVQIAASELPSALLRTPWEFAYRYANVPYELALEVAKIRPYITAETRVHATVSPEELELSTAIIFDVQRAGVFALEVDVPRGFNVRQVAGLSIQDGTAAEVDAYHLDESADDATHQRLTINLDRKALGRVALRITLARNLDAPALLLPSEGTTEIAIGVLRAAGSDLRREHGHLLVSAPASLRLTTQSTTGLRSVPTDEALNALHGAAIPQQRPTLAYAFAQDPASLVLTAQRRQPHVTVAQLLDVAVEPGVVTFNASFVVDVQYSGISSLRIDVPEAVSARLRNRTQGVRDEIIAPVPDDVAEGYVAWRFTGERELLGRTTLLLQWDDELADPGLGRGVSLELPRLVPNGADRAWGQIVLRKGEAIDLHESGTISGVRPIDPQHDLMPTAARTGGARAFEFQDDWSLAVTATQYELEDVKRTSIERSLLRMVHTRNGQVTVQALYRMRSARQRLAFTLPADITFDPQPLRINGAPATLERGQPGEYYVPLPTTNAGEPFLLEIRYLREDPDRRFEAPAFVDEPAAQIAYAMVYLPEDRAWIGTSGDWTPSMSWRSSGWLNRRPHPDRSDTALVAWVSEGITLTSDPMRGLQAGGNPLLFSTLGPGSEPGDTLRIRSIHGVLLNVLVFGLVLCIGIVLLRSGSATRITAVGIFIALLLLAGVFTPTLSLQIMDRVLLAAAVLVAILWAVRYLVHDRPRDPLVKARREAKLRAALAVDPVVATASPAHVTDATTEPSDSDGGTPNA